MAEDVSVLTSNPRLIKEKWDQRFSQPLEALFTKMLATPSADESPIFESIQSIAVTAFGSLPDSTTTRKLIVVSDMLQNVPEYSQYKTAWEFRGFATHAILSTNFR